MATRKLGISIDAVLRRMVAETTPALGYARRRRSENLAAWQRRLRKRLLELLAIDGRPRRPPPVRFVERQEMDGYVRRRGYMIAADELAVPFYLLEPAGQRRGRLGVCLAAHGHGPGKTLPVGIAANEQERQLIEQGERDYAVQAVRQGYLTICPDFRGFGELVPAEDLAAGRGGCLQVAMRSIHLGRCVLGQRVSDVMQLLDWALARRDVDRRRVVMTGNSGGGTMTLFAAAVDRRIAAAAPSCYFATFAGSILAMYHCPCNFVPGLQAVAEMADLAGLIAPRPLLVVAGTQDGIFPIDAVRNGFADAARIYADAGAAERIELYEGAGGHRYYAARTWAFFREQLGG